MGRKRRRESTHVCERGVTGKSGSWSLRRKERLTIGEGKGCQGYSDSVTCHHAVTDILSNRSSSSQSDQLPYCRVIHI